MHAGADSALNLIGAQKQKGVADTHGQLGIMGVAEGVVLKLFIFMND